MMALTFNFQRYKPYVDLAAQTRLLHWSGGLAGILFLGLFAVIMPLGGWLEHIEVKTKQTENKLQKVELIAEGTESFDVVLERLNEELHDLRLRALKPQEQAKAISFLSQTTEDLKIQMLNMSPVEKPQEIKEKEKDKKIKMQSFEMEFISSYQTLGVFFERLKKAPIILTVEEFTAMPESEVPGALHVKMFVAAYEETV